MYRIALVAEGVTDHAFLQAALEAILGDTISFELTLLQPKTSLPFGGSVDATKVSTGGWGGVYQWCSHVPIAAANSLLGAYALAHDFLIIHVDVDVTRKKYSEYSFIQPRASDAPLPCSKKCPPASDSADALQNVVQSWLPSRTTHDNLIFCLPADTLGTWVYAAFCPNKKSAIRNFECSRNIEHRLQHILPKTLEDYKRVKGRLKEGWPAVETRCSQGKIFADTVRATLL